MKPNNENENKSKSSKNPKRNIWFNPPFSKNISNNIGKYFLLLIQKHFPNNHRYHKILNENNVKISYSYMANIKSIINMQNKEVITEKKTQAVKCNCINKPGCPLSNQCQVTNLIYKARITTEPAKVPLKSVMETIRNHSIMKNIGQIQNFRKNTGDLKNSKHNLKYNFTF